jgi:hypothetical protein
MPRSKKPLTQIAIPVGEPMWLTRRRRVPVPYAAGVINVSEDTFRRKYPELIEQVSERRQGVELGRVLDLGKGTV